MSEQQRHTPEPWARHELTDGDTAITDECGVIDYPIAIVRLDPSAPGNADVILSAPTLLAAAQAAVFRITVFQAGGPNGELTDAIHELNAAIQSARVNGEEGAGG